MEQTAKVTKTKINFRQYGMIIALVILALFFCDNQWAFRKTDECV